MHPVTSVELPALGRSVQRIGLGTVNFRVDRRAAAEAVLDAWAEHGGDLIDTAAVYGQGQAETVLGGWLAARGMRERVVILTKGGHPDPSGRSRLDPASIAADLAGSLGRLDVDEVDLYLLHRDDPSLPVDELVDALDAEVRAGRARTVGVSNWTIERIEAARSYAARAGRTPISSSSAYVGLAIPTQPAWPGCVDALDPASVAFYRDLERGLPLIVWSAQSSGFFAPEFDPGRLEPSVAAAYDSPTNRARRDRARRLAAPLGIDAGQLALAYVLAQPHVAVALAGARDPAGVERLWQALRVELGAEDLAWLEDEPTGALS